MEAKEQESYLEKQVEIRILQKEIQEIEASHKKIFNIKIIIVLGLIGMLFGGGISYYTNYTNYGFERDIKISSFLDKSEYSKYIIKKYKKDHEILEYSYDSFGEKTSEKISQKEVKNAFNEIDKKVSSIEESMKNKNIKDVIIGALIGGAVLLIYYFLFYGLSLFIGKAKISKNKLKLIEIGATELKQNLNSEDEKDFFTQLVQINFKYLDQYYLQTQEQADKSFWISAIASIVGFLVIITGIILMYNRENNDSGYVATAAGVLSQFIAAIFFYLYNKTILKMSQYHQKLVITQNISLALKTADLLKDSKEKVLETLIDRLTMDVNKYLSNSIED
ncbi:hypothetical protein [Flavobacterium sp. ACN6]|uniref:TRADD-N-associated membrane domain-containing protein n=1 Tax=Flavobacterium sp. ACN6 TaxID=1920426 RepID=UPI000BB2CFE0|nr:hypothetical protein [Flavobacterium sp. ACN6]PBJ08285.1 hypothetical protein BSF42_36380 [Flavobacterium sp. ACN6]